MQIQEERRRNTILNSRAEYSRCTIPRLTAKMGNADYDKKVEEETEEEKMLEDLVRKEIAKRRKERCKKKRGRNPCWSSCRSDREETQDR